jgi:hypothetical protein
MAIGGVFVLETVPEKGENILDIIGGEDSRLCMSGRCAMYYCLLDMAAGDRKKIAYLPAYTCETVIAPYKKAGYALRFYDVSPEELTPCFDRNMLDKVSVMGLCGYYGFSSYDRDFVKEAASRGVKVIHDITHSVFSEDGVDRHATYTAGSLRKWMGVPSGGIAVKRNGRFSQELLPPEEEHLRGRFSIFEEQQKLEENATDASIEKVNEAFWSTEMRLRNMFDVYKGDKVSEEIVSRFPVQTMIKKRRENYAYIFSQNPFSSRLKPVFPVLREGVCPSHLTVYAGNRDRAREILSVRGIKTTIYWPFHEECDLSGLVGAEYIYNHIFSLPMDQRYGKKEMDILCEVIKAIG